MDQDWQTVTLRGNAKKTQNAPKVSAHTVLMRRLDHDEPVKIKKLSHESRQAMIQARVALSLNQTQLNTACSFPQNTVRDIEAGRATPSPTQKNALSRALKVVLKYD